MKVALANGTFIGETKKGETVYPTKCVCGGKLQLRYGGQVEEIYRLKPDGTVGRLKSREADIFWDTPILICEQCGEQYERGHMY